MKEEIDSLTFDLQEMSEQLAYEHALNVRHEQDFQLFSRKISALQMRTQQLQSENQDLKTRVRKLQYEPNTDNELHFYKTQLDNALYDNEALKV